MEEELRVIVSMPSENDCPRPGVVPFDANSSHFVLSSNSCRAFYIYIGRMEKSAGHRRHAQKQKQKPPPPPADTRGAVNQLTHRNKNKNEAKETPI